MSEITDQAVTVVEQGQGNTKVKVVGILSLVAGIILLVSGAWTWFTVQSQLASQNIVVAEDASSFAGEPVDGPFTAYAQAAIINDHTMEATGGLTYAELDREDPLRDLAMRSSFLQASLFTSVVAFGVAAFAAGMGILMVIIGLGFIWAAAPKRA